MNDLVVTDDGGRISARYKFYDAKDSVTDIGAPLASFVSDVFMGWDVPDRELRELQHDCCVDGFSLDQWLFERIVREPPNSVDTVSFYQLYREMGATE